MPVFLHRPRLPALPFAGRALVATAALTALTALTALAALSGCSSFDNVSNRLISGITPYKIEVVQGNFVSREQVDLLKPGMSRQQVRDILGTPLVTDLFHADRWDYVFTLKRQGVEPQERKLTVYFNGEALARVEGDPMPSETEFVATLNKRRAVGTIPPLQASEEQLKAFSGKTQAAAPPPVATVPPNTVYPPLEPPTR